MKRLTKTASTGTKLNKWCNMYEKCEDCTMGPTFCEHLRDGIEKFASYKDAEEQGLLVKLPCKIGDAIYRMTPETLVPITRDIIMQITICDGFILLHGEVISEIDAAEIGETAFLSMEEADRKLKELTK